MGLELLLEDRISGRLPLKHVCIMSTLVGRILSDVATSFESLRSHDSERDFEGREDQERAAPGETGSTGWKTEQSWQDHGGGDQWDHEEGASPSGRESEDSDPELTELATAVRNAKDSNTTFETATWQPSAEATRRGNDALARALDKLHGRE